MSSVNDLKDVLKETLENKGVLAEIRAKMRAEIFKTLQEEENSKGPEVTREGLIINELIREYLSYNSYLSTLSVFQPESGLSNNKNEILDRKFISKQLNIIEDQKSSKVPLLYSLIFGKKTVLSKEIDEVETNSFPLKQEVVQQSGPIYEDIFSIGKDPKPYMYKS